MNKAKTSWRAVLWLLVAVFASLAVTWLIPDLQTSPQMTPWVIARASGITAFVLLTLLTVLGLIIASVPNRESWRTTRTLLPLHRLLSLYLVAFIAIHVTAIALDSFAHVGIAAIFIPLTAGYRPVSVSLGTLSLYAIILLAITARLPRLLPNNRWLTVHRFALVTYLLTLLHGALTGSDTPSLRWLYELSAVLVVFASVLRYAFVTRAHREKAS